MAPLDVRPRRGDTCPSPPDMGRVTYTPASGHSQENSVPREQPSGGNGYPAWERRAPARPGGCLFSCVLVASTAMGNSGETSRQWFASSAGAVSVAAPHPPAPSPLRGEGERSPSPLAQSPAVSGAERGLGGEVCTGIFIHWRCANAHGELSKTPQCQVRVNAADNYAIIAAGLTRNCREHAHPDGQRTRRPVPHPGSAPLSACTGAGERSQTSPPGPLSTPWRGGSGGEVLADRGSGREVLTVKRPGGAHRHRTTACANG